MQNTKTPYLRRKCNCQRKTTVELVLSGDRKTCNSASVSKDYQHWLRSPHREGKKKSNKQAGRSRLLGGRFRHQGNLDTGLVLDGYKMSSSLSLPTRILKVYTVALTGFSQVLSPNGLNSSLLSQGDVLQTAPSVGMAGRTYISGTGKVVRSLQLPKSNWRVKQCS